MTKMKKGFLLSFIIILTLSYACNRQKGDVSSGSGLLQGSFFNIDTTTRGIDLPMAMENQSWQGNAWRGERINTQMVIWSPKVTGDVYIKVSDLTGPGNALIEADQINLSSIQYVMTDEFAEGCGKTGIQSYDSSLVADVLHPLKTPIVLMSGSPQLMWVSIDIPQDALPGQYGGTIHIGKNRNRGIEFEIMVDVMSPELHAPQHWSFHLDLWQNPYAEARYFDVEPWTTEHFEKMRPTMTMLANAGQKCVTTTITDQPWGGQTFDPFQSMVSKTRNRDGGWTYDYKVFDSWVEFAMECGIREQINCYSMVSWTNGYSYFDEISGKDTTVTCKPGSIEYDQIWSPFLSDFHKHLEEKNWAEITTISMDERSLEDLKEVVKLVNRLAPGMKIAFAGNYHPELDEVLYDLSVASKHIVPEENLSLRRESGLKTTFYVCCVEQRPNTFTFSNSAEATLLAWYAAYRQFDGMLRWSYNSWPPDPINDSRFRRFPAGDTYMVYPGGLSSVRFERLREGIQDYEKIRILKYQLKLEDSDISNEKLMLLNDQLATFDLDYLNDHTAYELVSKGKMVLNQLSE
jgi:hypothetical protein